MAVEDVKVAITAVAIVHELEKAMKDGSFAELQRVMGELGYKIELRKKKKKEAK